MNAETILKLKSPIARAAVAVLRSGAFGEGMDADKVRWWLQDRGLADGRSFTPEGERARAELLEHDRRERQGF